jgi:hypothetical protein
MTGMILSSLRELGRFERIWHYMMSLVPLAKFAKNETSNS